MRRDYVSFVQEPFALIRNSSKVVIASFNVTSFFRNIPLEKVLTLFSIIVMNLRTRASSTGSSDIHDDPALVFVYY